MIKMIKNKMPHFINRHILTTYYTLSIVLWVLNLWINLD